MAKTSWSFPYSFFSPKNGDFFTSKTIHEKSSTFQIFKFSNIFKRNLIDIFIKLLSKIRVLMNKIIQNYFSNSFE